MKKITLLLLLVVLNLFALQAQTKAEIFQALDQQDYKKAIDLSQRLLSQNPKDAEVLFLLGSAYFENEDFTNAQGSFNRGIAAQPKYALNYVGLGKVQNASEKEVEAKKNFEKALEITQSNNVEVLTQVAEAYLNSNTKESLSDAEKLLIKAKTLDSKNVFVYVALGDLYLKRRVDELALTNYRKALEFDKNFLRGYLRVGQLYIKDKKYQEGADVLKEALLIDANYAPAHRELGELYYKAGKYELAKNHYEKYVGLTKNDLTARARYATFLYLTDDFEEALREINSVLKDTSTYVLLRIKGYSLYKTNQYELAKTTLDEYFSRVNPKYILSEDYEMYARNYEKLKEDSLAVIYYYKAIEMDPDKSELRTDIANNYIRRKQYQEAVDIYKIIVAQSPGIKNYYGLGKAYFFLKDYENAYQAFEQMKKSDPEFYLGYLWSGNALAKMEDQENPEGKPKADYEKVVDLIKEKQETERYKRDYITANYYLAAFYYLTNDFEKCLLNCEEVLALEPNHEQCKTLMEYISQNKKP